MSANDGYLRMVKARVKFRWIKEIKDFIEIHHWAFFEISRFIQGLPKAVETPD